MVNKCSIRESFAAGANLPYTGQELRNSEETGDVLPMLMKLTSCSYPIIPEKKNRK